jgi:hypothetical protein
MWHDGRPSNNPRPAALGAAPVINFAQTLPTCELKIEDESRQEIGGAPVTRAGGKGSDLAWLKAGALLGTMSLIAY